MEILETLTRPDKALPTHLYVCSRTGTDKTEIGPKANHSPEVVPLESEAVQIKPKPKQLPEILWIPPKAVRHTGWWWFWRVLACLWGVEVGRRLGREEEISLMIFMVVTFVDPLLWAIVVGWIWTAGNEDKRKEKAALTFSCPHCGAVKEVDRCLRQVPVGSDFPCGNCNNRFVKTATPALPQDPA